jgi:hypothetical protein
MSIADPLMAMTRTVRSRNRPMTLNELNVAPMRASIV